MADVEQVTYFALQTGYYANAIELSREIMNMLKSNYNTSRHQEELAIPSRMKKLVSKLVKLNNGYLKKNTGMNLQKDRVTLPYFIDNELKRKRKQPSYIAKQNKNSRGIHFHKSNRISNEMAFLETCRNGQKNSEKNQHITG